MSDSPELGPDGEIEETQIEPEESRPIQDRKVFKTKLIAKKLNKISQELDVESKKKKANKSEYSTSSLVEAPEDPNLPDFESKNSFKRRIFKRCTIG